MSAIFHDVPAFLVFHRQVRIAVNEHLACVMRTFSNGLVGCRPVRMRDGSFLHENIQVVLGGEVQQFSISIRMRLFLLLFMM